VAFKEESESRPAGKILGRIRTAGHSVPGNVRRISRAKSTKRRCGGPQSSIDDLWANETSREGPLPIMLRSYSENSKA